jgi:hypothetical protein
MKGSEILGVFVVGARGLRSQKTPDLNGHASKDQLSACRIEAKRHVIMYVIPAEAIVLTKCNLLRYKASLLMPGQAVHDPSAGCSGDNLKGREGFSSPGAVRRREPEVEGTRQIPVR